MPLPQSGKVSLIKIKLKSFTKGFVNLAVMTDASSSMGVSISSDT